MTPESFRSAVGDVGARWLCTYADGKPRQEYLFVPIEMMTRGAGPRRVKVTFEILPDNDVSEHIAGVPVYEEVEGVPV